MRARRRRGATAVVVGVLAVATGALVGCGSGQDVNCGDYRFDASKWVDPHGEHQQAKRSEALALARCGRLIGRTDEQVVELLGRPSTREGSTHWVYALEAAGNVGDGGALELFFRDDRVTSTEAY